MSDGGEPEKDRRILHSIVLIFLGLLISWPVLLHGFPDLSNDGPNHASLVRNFARQFWSGDLYPRWLMNMNGGLGSPDFFYYPPLNAFVSTLFWPLVRASDPHGWLINGYSSGLATVLSGLTAYLWIRTLTTGRAALIGAAVYMIAPYHVAIDLYNRGAAAEYWLFAWLPLVMLSAQRVVENKSYAFVWLAITYALCLFSHGAVGACFGVVPLAYVLVFSRPGSRVRQMGLAVAGIAAGVGIAAVYLAPAILDRGKSWVAHSTSDWANYRNWWLFQIRDSITEAGTIGTGIPWYLSYKMRILVITLWMLGFTAVAYLLARDRTNTNRIRRHASFYLGVTLVSFFLMLSWSDFVWRVFPLLPLLQITHRLGTMIVLAAAALAALACARLGQRISRAGLSIVFLSMIGWFAADMVAATQGFAIWRPIPAARAAGLAAWTDMQMEDHLFWPIQTPKAALQSDVSAFARFIAEHPPKTAALTGSGQGDVRVVGWRPREFDLSVHALSASHVVLNHFYYEGWRALQKQSRTAIPLTATPDGLMDLAVPQGTYDVTVDLPPDPAERAGRAISLLSLLFCAGLAVWQRRELNHPVGERPVTVPQT